MTGGANLDHRVIGAELLTRTWELMGTQDRTVVDDDAMPRMAHASAHHRRAEGAGATADAGAADRWASAARRVADAIAEDDDREAVLTDLATIPGLSGGGAG